MLYTEFEPLIPPANETLDVWICDFRYSNYANKPIRHIAPTLARVTSVNELPARKTIYYADHYFHPIGSSGKIGATIIAPYDNTGYHSYPGNSINIFFTETECKNFYKNQCDEAITGLAGYIAITTKTITNDIQKILNKMATL